MKSFYRITAQPWAITEEALATIIEVARRENPTPEAVAAKLGRPLDNTHTVTVRDGVATIPVEGPLFPKANLMTRISGATAVGTLATDLRSALDDPGIRAVILDVDSPGGAVAGISEFADMIFGARQSNGGAKPIVAYVSDYGCSAAYWLASACDEVVMADTAVVGSIGVVAAYAAPDDDGSIEFVASQSPKKRPNPTTESGRAQIQAQIDDVADVFIATVARNRGVSTDTVLSDFGQGGVFVGQKAVAAGLADRVASYEALHAELASASHSGSYAPSRSMVLDRPDSAAPAASLPLEDTVNESTPATDAADQTLPEASGDVSEYVTVEGATDGTPIASGVITGEAVVLEDRTAALEARIAALEADRDEQTAKAVAAEERLHAAEAEREHQELLALASGWFGDAEKHVAVLKQLDPEARAFYEQTQRAHAEQLRAESVILKPLGVTNPQPAASDSFDKRLDGIVAAIRQENPRMSRAAAIRKAMRDDTELAAEYTRSQHTPSA